MREIFESPPEPPKTKYRLTVVVNYEDQFCPDEAEMLDRVQTWGNELTDYECVQLVEATASVEVVGTMNKDTIENHRDLIDLLIAAKVGVRAVSWGAAVSSNPRDRESTTKQLKEVSKFLTVLLESNGVL